MRILVPILGFAPQGGYRVLSQLANAWISMGHECDFLVPSSSNDAYFPTKARVIYCDVNGVSFNKAVGKKITGVDNVISLYSGLNKIGRKYDVVFANHSLTSWVVCFANCGNASKFYYIQAYEPDYYPLFKDPIKLLLAKLSYKLKLTRIVNSGTYRENNVDFVAVIPPGIDLDVFWEKADRYALCEKMGIVIGTIGRSEPYKGTSTAISAYRAARATDKRIELKIAFGNVPKAEDYEIVSIHGDAELADFYRSIDVLLVSCYSQHGAPHYPLIEAMACGTPVIHTDYYPGDAENSWKANSPSVVDVTQALHDFLLTPQHEIMKKVARAREVVELKLSWDNVAKSFIDAFNG